MTENQEEDLFGDQEYNQLNKNYQDYVQRQSIQQSQQSKSIIDNNNNILTEKVLTLNNI